MMGNARYMHILHNSAYDHIREMTIYANTSYIIIVIHHAPTSRKHRKIDNSLKHHSVLSVHLLRKSNELCSTQFALPQMGTPIRHDNNLGGVATHKTVSKNTRPITSPFPDGPHGRVMRSYWMTFDALAPRTV